MENAICGFGSNNTMENHNYPLPNKEEIILWNTGHFPEGERKNQISFLLENDPFIAAAFEGACWDQNFQHLPAQKEISFQNRTFKKHFLGWGIGLFIGVVIAVFIFHNSAENTIKNLTNQEESVLVPEEKQAVLQSPASESQKEEREETSNKISTENHDQAPVDLIQLDPSSVETSAMIPSKEATSPLSTASSSLKPLVKTIVLSDQKVYPYKERSSTENTAYWESVHVSAAFENQNEQEKNQEKLKSTSYLSYLEKALNHFNNEEWSLTLNMLNIILSHYPDDVNALYFKGQTLFSLGKKSEAKKYFYLVEQHTVHVFEKEAKEFQRRCLE